MISYTSQKFFGYRKFWVSCETFGVFQEAHKAKLQQFEALDYCEWTEKRGRVAVIEGVKSKSRGSGNIST